MSIFADFLRAEIARGGPIPFRQWMELALYHPEHGYYASGRAAIGRRGDYMTSVSVGPLFGRLLAGQFEELWEAMGRPAPFTLVEQGANGGDFAHDVLSAAQKRRDFYAALRVQMVEPFALQARRQQARLAEFAEKTAWCATPDELPFFTGIHFSNELLDAFPVHALVYRNGAWKERYVEIREGDFAWTDGPFSNPALEDCVPWLPPVEGYETEVNLEAPAWLEAVRKRLERGHILAVDYGFRREDYYLPQRTTGTLSCYRQHQRGENPLATPGEQDLTAHVDFTALTEKAAQLGLSQAGFTDQHHFLAALAKKAFPDVDETDESDRIDEIDRKARALTPEHQRDLRALATLLHPALLGRHFQFWAVSKNAPAPWRGFAGF